MEVENNEMFKEDNEVQNNVGVNSSAKPSGKIKWILLGLIVLIGIFIISFVVYSNKYSHIGTYKCVSSNGGNEKIVLDRDEKYTKTDDPSGYYEITKDKVILNPSNGDDEIVLLRAGEYLYSERGWYEDDSPYFKQKLPKGNRVDQVLTYNSDGVVNTVAGFFYISLDRTLELCSDGTYTYKYEQNNNGNKLDNTEKGTYKRTKKELLITPDNGKEYVLPIVDDKVVYVQAFKHE